jgi:hypothetical protein
VILDYYNLLTRKLTLDVSKREIPAFQVNNIMAFGLQIGFVHFSDQQVQQLNSVEDKAKLWRSPSMFLLFDEIECEQRKLVF